VHYARATGVFLDLLKKVRAAWPGRKKGAKRDLEKELDALEANLLLVVGELTKFLDGHQKIGQAFLEAAPKIEASWTQLSNQFGVINGAIANLAKIVPDHERRLLALEQRPEDRGKRASKKKR
jgi:ATP/maltotriose-dependent transcriptional regulator MalT